MERLSRAYVGEVPDSAIRAILAWPELLNLSGPSVLEPPGVLSGMILAAITRASFPVRLHWFQLLDWNRASGSLRAFSPKPPLAGVVNEQTPPGIDAVVDEEAFDVEHGNVAVHAGNQSCFWGVNSFARAPAIGGKVSEAASSSRVSVRPSW